MVAKRQYVHAIEVVRLPESPWNEESPGASERVVRAMCRDGFLLAENHGIDRALIAKLDIALRKVIALPKEVLEKYICKFFQRGYGPVGAEGAANSKLIDLKEFWMVRDPRMPDNPANCPFGPNVFPNEVEEFASLALEYFEQCLSVGRRVLECFEVFLELNRGSLVAMTIGAESMLRPIYYAALETYGEIPKGAVRSKRHGDINALTILAIVQGLQALLPNKKGTRKVWGGIVQPAGVDVVAVNNGMMLSQLEIVVERLAKRGLTLEPTIHRVINPEDPTVDRVSFPLFLHFLRDVVLNSQGLTVGEWFDAVIALLTNKK